MLNSSSLGAANDEKVLGAPAGRFCMLILKGWLWLRARERSFATYHREGGEANKNETPLVLFSCPGSVANDAFSC